MDEPVAVFVSFIGLITAIACTAIICCHLETRALIENGYCQQQKQCSTEYIWVKCK